MSSERAAVVPLERQRRPRTFPILDPPAARLPAGDVHRVIPATSGPNAVVTPGALREATAVDGAMHFLHVVSALGLTAAFGAEAAGLIGVRRSASADEALLWLRSRRAVLLIGLASIGLVLATGIYMTVAEWGADAWILVSLVSLVGAFSTRRRAGTSPSCRSIAGTSAWPLAVMRAQIVDAAGARFMSRRSGTAGRMRWPVG